METCDIDATRFKRIRTTTTISRPALEFATRGNSGTASAGLQNEVGTDLFAIDRIDYRQSIGMIRFRRPQGIGKGDVQPIALVELRTRLGSRSVDDSVNRVAGFQWEGFPTDPGGGRAHATRKLLAPSSPPANLPEGNVHISFRFSL